MSKLNIQKVPSPEERKLPIFKELDEIAEQIRVRAYNLFANRGFKSGHEFEDWLTAEHEICWPTAELVEEDDEFEIKVALAGFDTDEISLTATPREVIVKASHRDEHKEDDEKVHWSEFRSNKVYRRIALPADVDVAKVKAEFENGMLEIESPKIKAKPEVAEKKIRVSSAA